MESRPTTPGWRGGLQGAYSAFVLVVLVVAEVGLVA